MSTIFATLKADQTQARKDKNSSLGTLLSTLIGEMQTAASRSTDGNKDVSDALAVKTLKSFIGNLDETMKQVPADSDAYRAAQTERAFINTYVPQQLTDAELEQAIRIAQVQHGAKDLKSIMSYLKDNHAGLYDGKKASELAKARLSA